MSKDPAVLLYTNDFLEGTADLSPEEVGVYTILLCYQHRRGFLPNNTKKLARLVRLTEEDFEPIWKEIHQKFISYTSMMRQGSDQFSDQNNDAFLDKIINKRMYLESKKRSNYIGKKAVFAIVGNWFRHHSKAKQLRKPQKEKLKKLIDYPYIFENLLNKGQIEEYINTIADRFPKGSDQRSLILIEDVNVNVNEDVNENEDENENVNNIIESENLKMASELNPAFKNKLCAFFAQSGVTRSQKVQEYLNALSGQAALEEFIRQSTAYMAYKTASREKIHGWSGYQQVWQQTDWVHKLAQLTEQEQPVKRKFSINR